MALLFLIGGNAWHWPVSVVLFCGLFWSGPLIIRVTERVKINMLTELILTGRIFLSTKPDPGMLSGEWHNNHHLFPGSARAGFLPYQLDLAWVYIFSLFKLGMVSSYKDSKKEFISRYGSSPEAWQQKIKLPLKFNVDLALLYYASERFSDFYFHLYLLFCTVAI